MTSIPPKHQPKTPTPNQNPPYICLKNLSREQTLLPENVRKKRRYRNLSYQFGPRILSSSSSWKISKHVVASSNTLNQQFVEKRKAGGIGKRSTCKSVKKAYPDDASPSRPAHHQPTSHFLPSLRERQAPFRAFLWCAAGSSHRPHYRQHPTPSPCVQAGR